MQVRLSGAICGDIWMPAVKCGRTIDARLSAHRRRIGPGPVTLRDTIESWLRENDGDFQSAQFTADTEIIFEYRRPRAYGYDYHVKIFTLADCPSMADLVDQESYTSDFLGEY